MKHGLSYAAGCIASGLLALVFGCAHAQTTAAGPYYATPSWDQLLPAAARFVVLSNWVDSHFPSGGAAVLDRETGLVWERDPSLRVGGNTNSWDGATTGCLQNSTGGRKGWRSPSVQELNSLVDPFAPLGGLGLPAGHPFLHIVADHYWTATAYASDPSRAWVIHFGAGFSPSVHDKSSVFQFWCVRGGGPLPVY